MPKRSDIEAQIAALQQELEGADDDEDFEVEIFKDGKGARIPFKHSKGWLTRELGIDFTPPGAPAPQGGTPNDGGGGGGGAPAPTVRARRTRGGSSGGNDGGGPADAMKGYFPGARS